MKVPNLVCHDRRRRLNLSRLQNEGSQLGGQTSPQDGKSIKATE